MAGRVHILKPVERSRLPSLLGTVRPSLGMGGGRALISTTHIYQPQAAMQVPLSYVNWRENELEALFFLFFFPWPVSPKLQEIKKHTITFSKQVKLQPDSPPKAWDVSKTVPSDQPSLQTQLEVEDHEPVNEKDSGDRDG